MADKPGLPIPEWLAHRPTAGGLVVPWITPRTTDGRYLFGLIEKNLAEQALQRRLCGICGRPLDDRQILFMRLSDLPRQRTNEPAVDPICAHYTTNSCPMISGRLSTYRTNPIWAGEDSAGSARRGAPAEPWFAVWLREYRLVQDHGDLAGSYAGIQPLRIRAVTWRFPQVW